MLLRRFLTCVELSHQYAIPSVHFHRLPSYFVMRYISCWRCGREEDSTSQCQMCHATFDQTKINYFELFALPINYNINTTNVVASYHKLQKQFHPDKHSNDPELVQEMSKKFSTMVNKAYKTLLNPIDRGVYMLSLRNVPLELTSTHDPELLTDILEIDSNITKSGKLSILKIERKLRTELDRLDKELSEVFASEDYDRAQQILVKMRYFQNLMNKVKEKLLKF